MGVDGGASRVRPLAGRAMWLVHPWFVVGLVVLVVNDHLLKEQLPGWGTGKLSDVAGVAVVGIGAAVVVGPRWGLPLTGIAFALLKVVPGVAEVAAPVLGGVTMRDPSDLLALAVLPVLWRWLVDADADADGREPLVAPWMRRVPRRLGELVGAAGPVVAAIVAVTATTATSCSPSPTVSMVAADGESLHAHLAVQYGTARWARSDDGGLTWVESAAPATAPTTTTAPLDGDRAPAGPSEACIEGGPCWRVRDRRSIDRRDPGGEWTEEVAFTDAELRRGDAGCRNGEVDTLASIAATGSAESPEVVASFGADGVVTRDGDGTWGHVGVLTAPLDGASSFDVWSAVVLVAFGPALAGVVWLATRRRPGSRWIGVVVVAAGWVATFAAVAAAAIGLTILGPPEWNPARGTGIIAVAGMVITTIAAVVAVVVGRPTHAVAQPQPQPPPTSWPPHR